MLTLHTVLCTAVCWKWLSLLCVMLDRSDRWVVVLWWAHSTIGNHMYLLYNITLSHGEVIPLFIKGINHSSLQFLYCKILLIISWSLKWWSMTVGSITTELIELLLAATLLCCKHPHLTLRVNVLIFKYLLIYWGVLYVWRDILSKLHVCHSCIL